MNEKISYRKRDAVWLTPVKGLARLLKKHYPDALVIEGEFEDINVLPSNMNATYTQFDHCTHRNILVVWRPLADRWHKLRMSAPDIGLGYTWGDHYRQELMKVFTNNLFEELKNG